MILTCLCYLIGHEFYAKIHHLKELMMVEIWGKILVTKSYEYDDSLDSLLLLQGWKQPWMQDWVVEIIGVQKLGSYLFLLVFLNLFVLELICCWILNSLSWKLLFILCLTSCDPTYFLTLDCGFFTCTQCLIKGLNQFS